MDTKKARALAAGARYYRTNWRRRFTVLLGAARSRGGHSVSVTRDDLLLQLGAQDFRDYYTGLQLQLDPVNRYDAVSLDRLNNSLPYQPGNVVITTWRINRAKSNYTHDEFVAMCRTVVDYADKTSV